MFAQMIAVREKLRLYSGYRWLVFCTVTIGTFMMNVDSSIVTVALPNLQDTFHVGPAVLQWVVTAYFLTITSIVPIMGVAIDYIGRKYAFVLGVAIFSAGSILCALSTGIYELISFRVVQSVGSSMIMGNVLSIIVNTFPIGQRGKPLGIVSSIAAIGTIVGPVIGAFLIDRWGWPAIFWVNVPFGLLAVVMALILLVPDKTQKEDREKFDTVGAGLFFVAMMTLLLFVSNGHTWGWFSFPSMATLLMTVAGWIGFIVREVKFPSPVIDVSFFTIPRFSIGTITSFLSYVVLMFPAFLMPLFLTRILDIPIYQVGLLLTPQAIALIIMSPIAGVLGERYGYSWPAMTGMGMAAAGLSMLAMLDEESGYAFIVAALSLFGAGLGFFTSPNNAQVLESVPLNKAGVTGGILATVRNFGKVSGVAIAVLLFESFLRDPHSDESFNHAVSVVFYFGAAISIAAIVMYALQWRLDARERRQEADI